jgi:pre-mRNA-splicing factor CWC26
MRNLEIFSLVSIHTKQSTAKMSRASYIQKYLTAEPSSSSSSGKKRKRKQAASTTGLIIADDDALGWSNTQVNEQEEDGRPITVTSGSAEFRKAKKNAWKTVGVPALQPQDDDAAAADKIINEAAAENNAAMHADEGPVIEDEEGVVKMGDGTHAGLQSASAVAAQFAKRKKEEAEAWEREQGALGKKGKKGGAGEETVYRDATGRRIDISLRRQEARREADEKAKKELEEKEAQKGEVQKAMKEKRREELDEARFMPVARTIDDKEMNDELREVERWNDPAAQFLSSKSKSGGKGGTGGGKKVYMGAAAPNRYGIRPGHRWDGVDRGNGWEGERFKALNRNARNKDLDYSWQMDE